MFFTTRTTFIFCLIMLTASQAVADVIEIQWSALRTQILLQTSCHHSLQASVPHPRGGGPTGRRRGRGGNGVGKPGSKQSNVIQSLSFQCLLITCCLVHELESIVNMFPPPAYPVLTRKRFARSWTEMQRPRPPRIWSKIGVLDDKGHTRAFSTVP